jgi:hypothetical protein
MYEVLNKIRLIAARGKVTCGKVARDYIAARLCRRGSVARGSVAEPQYIYLFSIKI